MKKVSLYIVTIIMMISFWGNSQMITNAAEINTEEPMIFVERYEISNERIIPGEQFVLSLYLKNYSKTQNAKNVQLNIQNPEGVAPIYGTVSQIYIGDVGAGEEKEIQFTYDSWTTIKTDTLDFYATIGYDGLSNLFVLRVPSSADIPFNVISTNISNEAILGEYNSASLTFKVLGEENVSDVTLIVECNDAVVGSSQAGSITAGTTKVQSVNYILGEVGDVTLNISLEYVTSDGEKSKVLMDSRKVSVKERSNLPSTDINQQNLNESGDNTNTIYILGISGVLLLTIFLIVVVIIRKRR